MNNEERILAMLEQLQQGQAQTNERLDSMQGDIQSLKSDMADVKDRLVRVEITQENLVLPKIEAVAEGHGEIIKQFKRLNKVESEQEEHDRRIWVLEQAARAK